MKITICGSMRFMDKMLEIKKLLEHDNHQVFLPIMEDLHEVKFSEKELLKRKKAYILYHFKKIKTADGILILNFTKNNIKNYIGGNTLIEIGIAFDQNKKIFLYNPLPKRDKLLYVEEIQAMDPIVINGNLKKLK